MKKITTNLFALIAFLLLSANGLAAEATFDFGNNSGNWPVGEGVNFADGNLTEPITVQEVSLTGVQGEAKQPCRLMKDNSGIIALYIYSKGAIKLNAPEGMALTKIEVTMKTGTFDLTASSGAIAENIWTGNATEVQFNHESTGNRQISKIVVTTAEKNSETVTPAAESFDIEAADIATFNQVEDGKIVKLTLTNAKVNGTFNSSNYVEDASGATVIKGVTLTPNTVLNGYILGTKGTDNAIDYMGYTPTPYEPQLIATSTSTFEATMTVLTGTEMTIQEACQQANYGKLVTIKNVSISGTGQNKTLKDSDGNTMKARDYMGKLPEGYTWPEAASSITGIVIYYMTGWFLMPISEEAIATQQSSSALFDFVNNNMGVEIGTSSDINAGNLENVTLTMEDVELTFVSSPTMPTRYYENGTRGNQLQIIKDGQMRVTAPEGKAITSIKFTYNPSVNASTGVTTYQTGWNVDKGEGIFSDDKLTWAGNAKSVRFNATGAAYVNTIEVETADANTETVIPESDSYTKEVNGLAEFSEISDRTLVKLNLTDAVVTSGMVNEWGYYIQDGNAGANIYCTGLNLNVGDKLNGFVYVMKSKQTMGSRIAMREETNADNLTITSDGTYDPVTGSISALNINSNLCRVVKLAGVAVKGTGEKAATITDSEANTITIDNGSTNYYPYVIQDDLSTIDYAQATVVGILIGNSKGNKIMPLSITDDTPTGIKDINADIDTENAAVYNLQGLRMSKLQKGINIVNGKKIVVK